MEWEGMRACVRAGSWPDGRADTHPLFCSVAHAGKCHPSNHPLSPRRSISHSPVQSGTLKSVPAFARIRAQGVQRLHCVRFRAMRAQDASPLPSVHEATRLDSTPPALRLTRSVPISTAALRSEPSR